MPTRPYDEIAARNRTKWSPGARRLAERLTVQLDAEVSAQKALGDQIASARNSAHLTQPQLAAQTGIQQGDISRIERGLGNPTRDTLLRLVDSLGMRLVLQPKDSHPGTGTSRRSATP